MANTSLAAIPQHIGIILDGNRRWAKERGLPTFFGHRKGIANARMIVEYAQKRGVKILTLFGFSTENWSRSEKEVSYLLRLFEQYLDKYIDRYSQRDIQVRHIGSMQQLPNSFQRKLRQAIEKTKDNSGMILNLAINYGGRDEIQRMIGRLMEAGYDSKQIDDEVIAKHLDTAGLPDPELIIRTSGEQRVSGFLIWQAAYSELYFTKVNWPDFDEKEFDKAIEEYNRRQRRFGK